MADTTTTTATESQAREGPDGIERRACRLCGRPILIVRDAKTGVRVALDAAGAMTVIKTPRGPWVYKSSAWLQEARGLAPVEAFTDLLMGTVGFHVDHALICKGRRGK